MTGYGTLTQAVSELKKNRLTNNVGLLLTRDEYDDILAHLPGDSVTSKYLTLKKEGFEIMRKGPTERLDINQMSDEEFEEYAKTLTGNRKEILTALHKNKDEDYVYGIYSIIARRLGISRERVRQIAAQHNVSVKE